VLGIYRLRATITPPCGFTIRTEGISLDNNLATIHAFSLRFGLERIPILANISLSSYFLPFGTTVGLCKAHNLTSEQPLRITSEQPLRNGCSDVRLWALHSPTTTPPEGSVVGSDVPLAFRFSQDLRLLLLLL
jgi:hypothetical protein